MNSPGTRFSDPALEEALAPYLGGRMLDQLFEEFDREGYVIFESVLDEAAIQRQVNALETWLGKDVRGRNNFEGADSNRIYAMLAKDPVFADLVSHPLQLAFGERELGRSFLLYACLAINLLPGETAQPWHFDDSHCNLARPRAPLSMSTFWSLTPTTEENGATEIIPGSHLWGEERPEGASGPEDFLTGKTDKVEEDNSPLQRREWGRLFQPLDDTRTRGSWAWPVVEADRAVFLFSLARTL